jgi:LysM repeat protein
VAVLRGGSLPAATVASATKTAAPTTPGQPSAIIATATDSAGGTVDLPESKPSAKAASLTKASTYVVKRGDNLWVIAKRFGLTVNRLKSLNGLKTSNLKPGQKLKTG